MTKPTIRPYTDDDDAGVAEVFFQAIQTGAKPHYSRAQRDAWSGAAPNTDRWRDRLQNHHGFVAVHSGDIVGFMTLTDVGLLDHAYVLPAFRRTGLAADLYCETIAKARVLGLTELHTEASRLARPFFERLGWEMVREQQVPVRGEVLTNFVMRVMLD